MTEGQGYMINNQCHNVQYGWWITLGSGARLMCIACLQYSKILGGLHRKSTVLHFPVHFWLLDVFTMTIESHYGDGRSEQSGCLNDQAVFWKLAVDTKWSVLLNVPLTVDYGNSQQGHMINSAVCLVNLSASRSLRMKSRRSIFTTLCHLSVWIRCSHTAINDQLGGLPRWFTVDWSGAQRSTWRWASLI